MKLLHIFMLSMIIIGFLLTGTAIYSYSKLEAQCTSGNLRSKLQWAIGLGTTFMTLGIGYVLCVNMSGCDCPIDSNFQNRTKLYILLISLMTLGCILLPLTIGIKNELSDCNVDLGILPTVLIIISSIQISLPLIFIIYMTISSKQQVKIEKQDLDDESDESKSAREESKKASVDKSRRNMLTSRLNTQKRELSEIELKLDSLGNKRPNQTDLNKRELLIREIRDTENKIKSVGTISDLPSSAPNTSSFKPFTSV
jgi:hypothetical protein